MLYNGESSVRQHSPKTEANCQMRYLIKGIWKQSDNLPYIL